MDSDQMASMYAEIVNGVPKAQSRFAGQDQESSALWDQISKEVQQIKAQNPGASFDIPNEVPSIDGNDDPAWQSTPQDATPSTAPADDSDGSGASADDTADTESPAEDSNEPSEEPNG